MKATVANTDRLLSVSRPQLSPKHRSFARAVVLWSAIGCIILLLLFPDSHALYAPRRFPITLPYAPKLSLSGLPHLMYSNTSAPLLLPETKSEGQDDTPAPGNNALPTVTAATRPETANSTCQRWLLYDKPPKTGSTAIRDALHDLLYPHRTPESLCSVPLCLERAHSVCNGSMPRRHILGHTSGAWHPLHRNSLIHCLRARGYYTVTSIRPPPERWTSYYFYLVHTRGKAIHGVSGNDSFEDFMRRLPDCVLHSYYDGLGTWCARAEVSVERRVRDIAARYDEVVELGERAVGTVEKRVEEAVKVVNAAPRPEKYGNKSVEWSRLEPEWRLYWALKKRREKGAGSERQLCAVAQ